MWGGRARPPPAPWPAAPGARLPEVGGGLLPRPGGPPPQSRCQRDYLRQADTPLGLKQYTLTPMTSRRMAAFVVVAALSACLLLPAQSAPQITTPKEALGFNLGDDYQVANYTQLESYWKRLAAESPRMKLESIGKTEEGRDQWMAIVSSPDNIKKLDRYKDISQKLAHAEGLNEDQARALAREGKIG